MVVFNPVKREIDIKIVYYGPALCGKTTNLQSVHLSLNPQQRGELVSLATKDDRTLFFDFLPIELDNIKGFKTRFHIYTVPGQVFYTLTRKAVLTGVDGIIFVADSQHDKMEENLESLDDLRENLKYYKKDVSSIPFVMQYNKRDLKNILPLDEMQRKLNAQHAPYFEASAIEGTGVMQTLTMCCKLILKQIQDKSSLTQAPAGKTGEPERTVAGQKEHTLPRITLAEPRRAEVTEDDRQDLYRGDDVPSPVPEPSPQETAYEAFASPGEDDLLESAAPDDPWTSAGSEDSVAQTTEAPQCGSDFYGKEPAIDLLEPELEFNNVERNTEWVANDHGQQGGEEPPAAPPASAKEPPAPEVKADDAKKTCPRCSLKFNPNVKQCPICKVSLLPKEEEHQAAAPELQPPVETFPGAEEPPSPGEAVAPAAEHHAPPNGTHLEIVACGQPQKTSSTAIRVPLVMRINESDKEIEVDLAINFGNGLLK